MHKLSINEMTTFRWSFLDDVTAYKELGIDGIGIWRRKLSEFGEERGADLLQETGLAVASLQWGGGFTGADGRSFKESIEDALEGVRLAATLGSKVFIVVSGSRGGHTHNHARALLVDALKELGPVAAEEGISLALEPIHRMYAKEWTFLFTLDDALEILDRVGMSEVGLAFDTYHLWQEENLLDRIGEVAPLVKTVQLADWRDPPRSENDRAQIGCGVAPLKDIVNALDTAGYNGFYDVEILSDELWDSDYRELLQNCRQSFEALWNNGQK